VSRLNDILSPEDLEKHKTWRIIKTCYLLLFPVVVLLAYALANDSRTVPSRISRSGGDNTVTITDFDGLAFLTTVLIYTLSYLILTKAFRYIIREK